MTRAGQAIRAGGSRERRCRRRASTRCRGHNLRLGLARRGPSRVLDLGCSSGYLAARLRGLGHHVVGVDLVAHGGVKERVDAFFEADLEQGLPPGVSVPNFGHWYPRLRVALGRFDYDLPVEVIDRGGGGQRAGSGRIARLLSRVDHAAVAWRPQLFAYQLLYELMPGTARSL